MHSKAGSHSPAAFAESVLTPQAIAVLSVTGGLIRARKHRARHRQALKQLVPPLPN